MPDSLSSIGFRLEFKFYKNFSNWEIDELSSNLENARLNRLKDVRM